MGYILLSAYGKSIGIFRGNLVFHNSFNYLEISNGAFGSGVRIGHQGAGAGEEGDCTPAQDGLSKTIFIYSR